MQYGFLIDHRRCIGCHACTVACKQENDVPVGNFRTWVKYVEQGRFPEIKRHFAVLRCNHCTNAPCVTICPVTALEKRKDGIVDVDRDVCIGCRACMQACPYDAIYLNEEKGAIEKCHYCAHRIEKGLEPACVIVCPEHAIVSGDLHDPNSDITRMIEKDVTLLRNVDQKTGPNVHYLGAHPITLHPGAATRPPTYLWSERPAHKPEPWPASLPTFRDARVTLDAGHKVEWGGAVALYLVTKGIAAGAALLAPFSERFGLSRPGAPWLPEAIALLFTIVTTFLLVEDLKRPKLFLTLLTRPNWRSWLVKGAWILIAFSITVTATLAASILAGFAGSAGPDGSSGLPAPLDLVAWDRLVAPLRWVNAVLAVGVAGYTAFLFQQCEGRDLWQSKILLPHLLAQALVLGSAVMLPFARGIAALGNVFGLALVAHMLLAFAERWRRHPTDNGKQAAAFLDVVKLGGIAAFRTSLYAMILVPLLVVVMPVVGGAAAAALLVLVVGVTLASLYLYEWAFVRAAQLPPLS